MTKKLLEWKASASRKPLILNGARQVGKTWLMLDFAKKHFENYVYINFDEDDNFKYLFDENLNIERIVSDLSFYTHTNIEEHKTLIILDEIQEAPRALTSLKYFCESKMDYYVIAAGSILGIAMHQGASFPVGKVDFQSVYPLSFDEFLYALDKSNYVEVITNALRTKDTHLIDLLHEELTKLLKIYYLVGGMPEVVKTYINTNNFKKVRKVQRLLLQYYKKDFSKYPPKEYIPRINMVWDSLPSQLAKENKKFIYGVLKKGARAKEFELAIQWLEDTGLVHKCFKTKKPYLPLVAYRELNAFKLYVHDVGLLSAHANIDSSIVLEKEKLFTEFKGALTEQYVAQELINKGFALNYYSNEHSTSEVDFLLQEKNEIIPLEVKAEKNLQAKSLSAFISKFETKKAVRTSLTKFKNQEIIDNVPLYMIGDYCKKSLM